MSEEKETRDKVPSETSGFILLLWRCLLFATLSSSAAEAREEKRKKPSKSRRNNKFKTDRFGGLFLCLTVF